MPLMTAHPLQLWLKTRHRRGSRARTLSQAFIRKQPVARRARAHVDIECSGDLKGVCFLCDH
eukprot:3503300-Heterocapsa_arctica.AAC.1